MGRVLEKRFFQRLLMLHKFTDGGFSPVEFAKAIKAVVPVNGNKTVNRRFRNATQARDFGINHSLADEPKCLHPLLHAWVWMREAFLVERLLIRFGERQLRHPWPPFRRILPEGRIRT